jgi:hypothetical protein
VLTSIISRGGWEKGNLLAKTTMNLKESHEAYQSVYFKKPPSGKKQYPTTGIPGTAIAVRTPGKIKMTRLVFGRNIVLFCKVQDMLQVAYQCSRY